MLRNSLGIRFISIYWHPLVTVNIDTSPISVTADRAGHNRREATRYRVTDKLAVLLTPPAVTVIVDDVVADTTLVVTVKVTLVAPAGIVTDAATVAAVVLLDFSVTTVPPAGAGPFKVIVPVLAVPPFTAVGFSTNVIGAHVGVTWRTAFCKTAL